MLYNGLIAFGVDRLYSTGHSSEKLGPVDYRL